MSAGLLTLRELNRATLARQLLLERVALPPLEAVRRLVGLQAQLPAPPFIGLWTRLQHFQRQELTQLLLARRVVRATMMRATLHVMTAEDYRLFRPLLQPALTRSLAAFFGARASSFPLEKVLTVARDYLQEQPRTFAAIRAQLAAVFPDVDPALLAYAVRMCLPLIQVPTDGPWGFDSNPAYADAAQWLDDRPASSSQEERLRALMLRYLAAFGPASVQDLQVWSGLSGLQEAVKVFKPELQVFRDEQGRELLDVPGQPLPGAEASAPLRFLPEFDNLLLAHNRRERVLPEQYRSQVILPPGRVLATFLLDGFVAGTWKVERQRGEARLIITPFAPLASTTQEELLAEGERLIRFVEPAAERQRVIVASGA
jgi:hypothetical protein